MNHEEFEKNLMSRIIDCVTYEYPGIEKQFKEGVVINREFDGYGFYTNFDTKQCESLGDDINLYLGNIDVYCKSNEQWYGTILFVESGRITFLEGFPYDSDIWDIDYNSIRFIKRNDKKK